jgi:dihydroorotase
MKEHVIRKVFEGHFHPRDGRVLNDVIGYTASVCGAAVVMGNRPQPVDNLEALIAYRKMIRKATKSWPLFTPIMTIMLTPRTTVDTVRACAPYAKVLKLIPTGTSTNSQNGVPLESLQDYYEVLDEVRRQGMIFSVHAEKMFDRSGRSIPEAEREIAALPIMERLIHDMPGLKIVIEHASTMDGCDLIKRSLENVAGTITAHHAYFSDSVLYDRHMEIVPEFYCKPVLKNEAHRRAVEEAMISGSPKFFFGSDSAPHPGSKKFQQSPPAAGIFSAPVAIPLIAEIFDNAGQIDRLENFLSIAGRNFYGLPIPEQKIAIINDCAGWVVPETVGEDKIPVLMGGKELYWRVETVPNEII